jgi:hypothetical protein
MRNLIIGFLVFTLGPAVLASKGGGGGDASEARVNEIRSDILKWIKNGGAKGLRFPSPLTYDEYVWKMSNILEEQKVIVGFVEENHPSDEELQVSVGATPKTCRGFYSNKDDSPRILCQISRFSMISSEEQYKLIHHEYAGLVNIEQNIGAASDYKISTQLSEFLTYQTVLKLAVKNEIQRYTFPSEENAQFGPVPFSLLKKIISCNDDKCRAPTVEDVQSEIDMFLKKLPARQGYFSASHLSLQEIISVTAIKIRMLAGQDPGLKSYKFFQEAADQIESLKSTDALALEASKLLQIDSQVISDLTELKNLIIKYENKIAAETDPEFIEGHRIMLLKSFTKRFWNLSSKYPFEAIVLRFFDDSKKKKDEPQNILDRHFDLKFSISSFTNGEINCYRPDIFGLQSITIGSQKDKYHQQKLSLLGDNSLIKKIIDNKTPLTIKCEEMIIQVGPWYKYKPQTNTLTHRFSDLEILRFNNSLFPQGTPIEVMKGYLNSGLE